MPVKSQPRLTARPLSRPSQPPPPPPIKAPKTEVCRKGAITAVRDGSADVADAAKVSAMLLDEDKKRPPSSQKQNFPQLDQSSSAKVRGSGFLPARKPAPPVPTKPAHLQRNCLTPPPKPGNLSSVLGLSSYSLPEYELSDLEHPQLSSTLMSQVLPRTHLLPKVQTEAAKSEPEPELTPPQVPVRRESMNQINDMMLRESKRSSTSVSTLTSLEESFITRFRPVSDFPAPEVCSSCVKTYPSIEQGSVARSKQDQVAARASSVSESEGGSAHSLPPLPSTAPPSRSISDSNINDEHNPVIMTRHAQTTVPPPPPLPVENINISAVKSSESTIPPPPPPPLPSPDTCPVPVYASSAAKPVAQASTPNNQSKEQPMTCKTEAVNDSPISVTRFVKSGFADNLAKLYGATKMTEHSFPEKPPPLAAKPRPPPPINRKPGLVKGSAMKLPQRPPSLRMKQPLPAVTALPTSTIPTSASPALASSSSVSARMTNTSTAPKPPRSAPPPPPPAPLRTSSLSTSPPLSTSTGVHCDKSTQSLSRSQSVRSAPPPPVAVHSSGLDRSHSLKPANTSPVALSSEMIRKYSFRAAPPPPPQSPKPTESPGRDSSSQGSSRLGGRLQSQKLLIC